MAVPQFETQVQFEDDSANVSAGKASLQQPSLVQGFAIFVLPLVVVCLLGVGLYAGFGMYEEFKKSPLVSGMPASKNKLVIDKNKSVLGYDLREFQEEQQRSLEKMLQRQAIYSTR